MTAAAVLAPASPTFAYNDSRPVLAYYYAWWDPVELRSDALPAWQCVQLG